MSISFPAFSSLLAVLLGSLLIRNVQAEEIPAAPPASALPAVGNAVPARPAAGYVKKVSGEAWVQTGEHSVKAVPGTPLYAESRIRTGSNAQLGLTLRDDTLLSLGPDTLLQVGEFAYAPEQGKLQLALSMFKGTLHYISGVIARLRPEAVSVKTPSGIIGVRGTRFAVKVEE